MDLVPDHYFPENLVAPGIEPKTSGSVAMNSKHYTTEAVFMCSIDIYCKLFLSIVFI
jgi:hypothetical protein